jgi:hypothetical protein
VNPWALTRAESRTIASALRSRGRVDLYNKPYCPRPDDSQEGTANMNSHSRLASWTLRCIVGLVLLLFGFSDARTAARGDVTRQRIAEGSWVLRAHKAAASNAEPDAATKQRIRDVYGRLPLSFEKNEGQTDPHVEFVSRGRGYTMFLSHGGEAVLALSGSGNSVPRDVDPARPAKEAGQRGASLPDILKKNSKPRSDSDAVLRLKLVGATTKARAKGREALPGKVNYLLGNDRRRWRTNIPTFAKVAYKDIYPGVDLVLREPKPIGV